MTSSKTTGSEDTCGIGLSESALLSNAFERLRRSTQILACCNVPLLGRCVDLAYVYRKKLITVEFKLRDWRRAINQANDHRLGADYAYVCMPKREITEQMRRQFTEAGVGLLFYRDGSGWPFKTAVTAPQSQETWGVARRGLWDYVASHSGEPA